MFEYLRSEYAGMVIAIDCGKDRDLIRRLFKELDNPYGVNIERVILNINGKPKDLGLDYAISVKMPELGEPGRPKWGGWCDTGWYRESGFVVVDYASVFEPARVFTPPQIPIWEETI